MVSGEREGERCFVSLEAHNSLKLYALNMFFFMNSEKIVRETVICPVSPEAELIEIIHSEQLFSNKV